ncbi:carbohydrate ABC transporter membrane protein 1 (CUT1 family) [Rhizobium sp. PP-F2F-G38]|uniref:Sugar ABC transporter permease n=1 Tax=Ferranicluibacter rubi TaxID=2715133 RepID=A0AA44CA46_9HYPH|nr:sugar ABC transporter permease [Ferranicluibacter rubi]PYE32597.1 carbohydrate ABC transporter membrane protein 1 (CUT1 family) [Rhizobium sp. PP-WC-1G-195]PYE96026.1 carbohydrate ABC transporter membrane protein 1 (CUT1 family) [Rhizobium sp. PP-F2F-G38]TCP88369.1 carbohydrate ABC transporter membrane protein 1 (CUT1 family) [Rhizobium sp. PP-CC-2G-626]TCQ22966.1 carbohydrate ABC transporter membrane protein 1 (CUT1 family) [Rhizobium sp. PP-CC-3G-465]NHT75725.1 sugar ABC transporter perme
MTDVTQQGPLSPRGRRDMLSGAMLLPALALVSLFILAPAVYAIVGSFFEFTITSRNWVFVGFGNYVRAAGDPVFWTALRNNAFLIVGSAITQVGLGTILAAILDRGVRRGNAIYRTIIFMPVVVSSIAVAFVWILILDPNVGPLNAIVKSLGMRPPKLGWLGDPQISLWMLLVIAAWQNVGFQMILVLAGLQSIPKELYEAAALDGAKGLRAFRYITLPGIRNVLIVGTLITVVGGLKVFDLVFVTTGGGPANATQVLGTYSYLQAFRLGNMGYANAMSVVLLAIAVLFGWLQLRLSRKA